MTALKARAFLESHAANCELEGLPEVAARFRDAASQLETLERMIARLREALEAICDHAPCRDVKWVGMNARDIARAALKDIGE